MKQEGHTGVVVGVTILAILLLVFSIAQFIKCNQMQNEIQNLQKNNKQISDMQKKLDGIGNKVDKINKLVPTSTSNTSVTGTSHIAYLTFDDGPSTKNTPSILDTLKKCGVKATFFVVGKEKQDTTDKALIKREYDEGNTVGIHSWTHDYQYMYANEQNFLTDFHQIEDFVTQITGVKPTVFRFPGGTDNTVSKKWSHSIIMPKLLADVNNMGFKEFDWNAYAGDADRNIPTKEQEINNIIGEVKALHGKNAVILCHDGAKGSAVTAQVLPEVIVQLKAMGYTFAPLSPFAPLVQSKPNTK